MNILIVGGTQFIGYEIAKSAIERGHKITIFHRGIHKNPFEEAEEILCDWHNLNKAEKLLKGKKFDVVINTICFSEKDAYNSYILFKESTEHFINISSASVYLLNPDLYIPFKEEDALLDIPIYYKESDKHKYAFGKREADIYFLTKFARTNFPCTIIRLPIVIGENDYTGRIATYYKQIEEEHPIILPDGGNNLWGFVYVKDVAKFITKILKNKKALGNVYNLSMIEGITLRQLIIKIGKLIEKVTKIIDIPSTYLLKTPLGLNFSPLYSSHHIFLDISKAIRDFDFIPTPFEKCLKNIINDFKKNPPEDLFQSTRELEKDTILKYLQNFKG